MKTIQVIKLQIDLLGLDIENLQNDDKIEALEEMERTLSILESMKSSKVNVACNLENDDKVETLKEMEKVKVELEANESKIDPLPSELMETNNLAPKKNEENLNEQNLQKIVSPHECSFCGRNFERLEKHKPVCRKSPQYIHSRKLSCDECDFRTFTDRTLRDHKRRHAGVYQCQKCQYKAYTKGDLNKHVKRSQNCVTRLRNKETFKCKVCDYSTSITTDFKYHKVKHTIGQ